MNKYSKTRYAIFLSAKRDFLSHTQEVLLLSDTGRVLMKECAALNLSL